MLVLHHNDLDGRCAGAIVASFENNYDQKRYIEMDYNKKIPFELISKNELVYIVDLSFTESTKDQLDELMNITKNIIWIDHHESSIKLVKKYPKYSKIKGVLKKNISGAGLTYMYLYKKDKLEECPKYIQLVSDFDCWIYKFGDETNHFKYGIDCYDYGALSGLWITIDNEFDNIIDKGKAVYEYITNANLELINKYAFECTFEGLKCLAINKRDNSIVFGDRINDYDIVSTFVFDGNKYNYSLFTSKDNVNCSKLAEKYGGGGHVKAAGFTSNKLIF